ncbi:hypothetical protein DTA02_22550 [Salmonella enterica subsp. enterica serovar Saintpaul]|nr:hypothetical protein [Salmonella enterica subsp. enterica serovar Saintpaul]
MWFRPFGPGRPRFLVVGGCRGLEVSSVLRAVTGARRLWRWEVLLEFPDRRGRESAARAGIFEPIHRAGGEQVMFLKEINTVV